MKKVYTILTVLALCCLGMNAEEKEIQVTVTDVITGKALLETKVMSSQVKNYYDDYYLTCVSGTTYHAKGLWIRSSDYAIKIDDKDSPQGIFSKLPNGLPTWVTFDYAKGNVYDYGRIDIIYDQEEDAKEGKYDKLKDLLNYAIEKGNVEETYYKGEASSEYDLAGNCIGFVGGTSSDHYPAILNSIKIDWIVTVKKTPVHVGPSGISSFCSNYSRDFTDTEVTAYIATGIKGNSVTLKEVKKVPAGVGVMVMAKMYENDKEGKDFDVPSIFESIPCIDETNYMVGVWQKDEDTETETETGTQIEATNPANGNINYVLLRNKETGEVAFHPLGEEYKHTVSVGKAYLSVPTSLGAIVQNAPLKIVFEDEEPTGIEAVNCEEVESGDAYNLQGIKVDGNYKGFVIKNGKKFYNR